MKCIVKVLSSALLAAGIIMPELNAAQIPIDMGINPSFETDAVLDGQRKNGNHTFPVPGGETTIAGGWHNYSPGGAGSGLGVGNPSAAEFATAGGDAGPLPSTADGAQALYLVGSNSFAYRISSTTIQPGNDYTAIVAFGAPLIDSPSGIVEMYLSMGPSGFFAAITPRLRFNANEIPLGTYVYVCDRRSERRTANLCGGWSAV
jgi:hypothetical protein